MRRFLRSSGSCKFLSVLEDAATNPSTASGRFSDWVASIVFSIREMQFQARFPGRRLMPVNHWRQTACTFRVGPYNAPNGVTGVIPTFASFRVFD